MQEFEPQINDLATAVTAELRQFEQIFERAGDGLLILDENRTIQRINARGCKMLGLKPSELISNPFDNHLSSESAAKFGSAYEEIFRGDQQELSIEITLVSQVATHDIRATLSVLDFVKKLVILDLHDIDELKHALELQHQQSMVNALAGATAHKLNQPLTAVIGYIQMLQRSDGGLENRITLDKIEVAATEMAELVREIGRITRFEMQDYAGVNEILNVDSHSHFSHAPTEFDPNRGE